MEITQQYLKENLDFSGLLPVWIKKPKNSTKQIGDVAGNERNGYRVVGINRKQYLVHRLVFLYHYGYMPKEVDHIDGNPLNNSIENLRAVTHQENCFNSKTHIDSSSGIKGVYKTHGKRKKKWRVMICKDGIGKTWYFETKEEAEIAVKQKRIEIHGEFARHN